MEIINKISNGLHLDNNEYDQPEGTMRDSCNGIIMDLGGGNYEWTNIKGAQPSLILSSNDIIFAQFPIRERQFIIVYNNYIDKVYIYELNFNFTSNTISLVTRWTGLNSILGLDINYPVTAIFGYYESDYTQRVYWTDDHNSPRTINLGTGGSSLLDEKFLDLTPQVENVGQFRFTQLAVGGNCKAGNYFFSWRLYKDGYYTDWSHITNPVSVLPGNPLSGYTSLRYHKYQGAAPDENCNVKIKFYITDYDTDYDSIQICAFYSNDYNSISTGILFYDGILIGSGLEYSFQGNENIGTVTLDELKNISLVIKTCKDLTHIKNRMIPANITEREELNIINNVYVTMNPIVKRILLDDTGYPTDIPATNYVHPLYNISSTTITKLIKGIQYKAIETCVLTDGVEERTIPVNTIFELITSDSVTLTSGTVSMIMVKKKFKPIGSSSDINTYELDTYSIYNHFYNYKNPIVSNNFRGYPGGETIRLGIVFFDLTGRPFFVRHLYNQTTTYGGNTIGPGDITIPKRYPGTLYHTHNYYEYDGTNYCYQYIVGNIIGISISGIDITKIKDKISGFSIVRAPIERQILGYGVLGHILKFTNNLFIKPKFCGELDTTNLWDKGYTFWCPEDLFELTDFSIQQGDSIVNSYYLEPYYKAETNGSYTGVGRLENTSRNSYYQKFIVSPSTQKSTGNGAVNLGHELSAYTKYNLGDDTGSGISVDPANPSLLFKEFYTGGVYATNATCCSILVFNELDELGTNIKGEYNLATTEPRILICHIKRTNTNQYGGLSDSALANTNYISTGHYQEINDTVLSQIFNGSKYIFNEIEIFGGDSFVCMFDMNHLLRNEDVESYYCHSFIVPIETRVNLDLREGNHIGKDRTKSAANDTGLNRETGANKWEEFNYNDGYSTDNAGDYYIALPNNFQNQINYDTRIRYSDEKTNGELIDSFRKFAALNYIDIDTSLGEIINIKSKFSKIIYWQIDGIGYIPVNERALSSSPLGEVIQLGIAGIFERFDNVIDKIGNSNHFGLTDSPEGFHWYDAKRKLFITMNEGMQISPDSIVKGLDTFFSETIPDNMYSYDNPFINLGITGGYDPRLKIVFITFLCPNYLRKTIGLDTKTNKFIGFFTFRYQSYFNYKKWMYGISYNNHIAQFGVADPGYFDGYQSAYFSIIIRDNNSLVKLFDYFEYIGSENPFTRIKFENSKQSITEIVSNNRNLKFRNKRWYGNFPKINRERLVDGYLKITFYYDGNYIDGSYTVTFNQLKTTFNQMI
jgi:hypothetical protein